MTETLHHTTLSKLTGYSQSMISRLLRQGIIECTRDEFGLPRFDVKVVKQLKARAALKGHGPGRRIRRG